MPARYLIKSITKLVTVIAVFAAVTYAFVYAYFYIIKGRAPRIAEVAPHYTGKKDILVLPYNSKAYSGFGTVFEPKITLKVRKKNEQYEKIDFLLDSGAVVSTLPINYAEILGKDTSNSKRIVLRGFGNKRTFGYMSNIDIKIKDKKLEIPIVFSEGETTKRILGRNGLFDKFTVVFDHKDRVVRLSE